ncbi:MAG: cytochrome c biogenesis protein CcsA [Thaumarchaeota archaeon]|nr:cytochrome c biogenesis protein CcsA [Nitrososphaerota archaeon]MCL5317837.1 cytochrome c biogenesis protein CcsA [Nitrososphaerota archaeon]
MDIGFVFIVVSLIASAIAFISFARYIKQQDNAIYKFGRIALVIETVLITVAISILTYYFLTRDFNVEYVASYSDSTLPLAYTISALWGGASGSMLLWAWLLSLFMTGIAIRERKDRLTGYALSILLTVNMFFLLMLVFIGNPFKRLSFTPMDGNGLNPLLQNPGMFFHPPTLFVGYAGLTIPFAFALAGLLAESELWVFRVRKWMLFAWLFVGLGIWFGGWWSYSVLGWGGYWAWDPVENSSLVPWLLATALLHSVMLQESRRGMKLWNILLSIGAFETVILGTFLTRSGIISSVHAFGEQGVGPVFTSYLLIMLAASLGILWHRLDQVKSMNVVTSATGRESSFLLNNLLFVLMALTVVWGTLFPMINEAVTHTKMSVGPGFYNVISPWVLTLLSGLMGVCIILKWGTTNTEELIRKLRFPLVPAVASIPLLYLIGVREPGALAGFALAAFVISIHLEDYLIDAKDYAGKKKVGFFRSMGHLILVRRRRYGGYIVHLSMILLLIGIVGTNFYKTTYSTTLKPNEPTQIGEYTFTFDSLQVSNVTMGTDYNIGFSVNDGSSSGKFTAKLTDDQKMGSTIVSVGILSTPYQDVYVIPEAVDNQSVSLTVNYNPLISFVWYGFGVTVIGVAVGLLPKRLGGGEKLEQN